MGMYRRVALTRLSELLKEKRGRELRGGCDGGIPRRLGRGNGGSINHISFYTCMKFSKKNLS